MMTKKMTVAAFVAVCGAAMLFAGAASAQTYCPEGKAPGGGCVDAGLAGALRTGTVIATHPKINATVPLNTPSEDGFYPAAKHRFEYVRIFGPRIPQINNPYDYQINFPALP